MVVTQTDMSECFRPQEMQTRFRPRPGSALRTVRFAGVALSVAAAYLAAAGGLGWLETYDAENFGDRRLAAPRPEECRMAREIVRSFAERYSSRLRRAVGAGDRKLELLAFAWWSDGLRAPPGADWRWCPGMGRYIRSLGLERMASGGMGPSLYISRASPPTGSAGSRFWVTFFPPQAMDPKVVGRYWAGSKTWRVDFRPARETASTGPKEDSAAGRRPVEAWVLAISQQ
jgi:hypothetical protein